MSKRTVQNVTGYPIPLAEVTLGFTAIADVEIDETVQNYIDNGSLVVIESPKKGKE